MPLPPPREEIRAMPQLIVADTIDTLAQAKDIYRQFVRAMRAYKANGEFRRMSQGDIAALRLQQRQMYDQIILLEIAVTEILN